jgi:disulfide bond formation protein DsbB
MEIIAGISFLSLLGVFVAQYGFNIAPCQFCIYERYPYAIAFILSLVGMSQEARIPLLKKLLAIVFLGSVLITAYHVAVEHEWVPSPTACQSDLKINKTTTIQDLKVQLLEQSRVTPCHMAPIKILGFSLAEYNLLLSLGLVIFCLIRRKL